jgi:hypothetical protein
MHYRFWGLLDSCLAADAEGITMEIVGEFMGKDHDQGIWRYFRNHWHGWFPNLGSRANFAKQNATNGI